MGEAQRGAANHIDLVPGLRVAAVGDAGVTACLVLSEPLVDLPDAWAEIPEETVVIAKGGSVEHHRFVPRLPMIDSSTNQASYGQAAG